MHLMEQNDLIVLIAKVLEADASSLTLESNLKERNWDSLADVMLIAELDDALGIIQSSDALRGAETVADIHALVQEATV